MNLVVFWAVLIGVPVGVGFCVGLVRGLIWIEDRHGFWWSTAFAVPLFCLALALLLGWLL